MLSELLISLITNDALKGKFIHDTYVAVSVNFSNLRNKLLISFITIIWIEVNNEMVLKK
jgi:hypothetical protein